MLVPDKRHTVELIVYQIDFPSVKQSQQLQRQQQQQRDQPPIDQRSHFAGPLMMARPRGLTRAGVAVAVIDFVSLRKNNGAGNKMSAGRATSPELLIRLEIAHFDRHACALR